MARGLSGHEEAISCFRVVAPQEGGYSLAPMEGLLRVVRSDHVVLSLEVYGAGGAVGYQIRSNIGSLGGRLGASFPQSRIDREQRRLDVDDYVGKSMDPLRKDWMFLDESEFALVQPLHLLDESYLPLRIYDDRYIRESERDPLAAIIGLLSSATEGMGGGSSFGGGERMGIRVVIRPAKENWGVAWQNWMQQRRDGEDRRAAVRGPDGEGPSFGLVLGAGGIVGVAGLNWFLWQQGLVGYMVAADAVAAAAAGFVGWYSLGRRGRKSRRPYVDEQLVEDKLKSLAYYAEVQLVRVYRNIADEDLAEDDLGELLDSMRYFDDPVGNAWRPGKIQRYEGEDVFQGEMDHPFRGGDLELGWLDEKRSRRTVLSVRELACLWHPPLGSEEMASMERTSASVLVPYMPDLSSLGEDSGPLVGLASHGRAEVRLPASAIRKHAIILGKSGTGKSTLIKHVIDHMMQRKVRGEENSAVVVIDPHASLVKDILKFVPPELVDKIRLLDFGRTDRIPGINLLDPELFPDRDRCVDVIVTTIRNLHDTWGGRLEDLLRKSLMIIYEFNRHPDTPRAEMLTVLDLLLVLEDGVAVQRGRSQVFTRSEFQSYVLSRVESADLHQWFDQFLTWGPELRAEALSPVHSRIGSFASNQRASVVMGQRESTIQFRDVLSEGLVVLVSTASGEIGNGPAALLGGTMVSLVEAALREQESLDESKRAKCLLVCDEFQTVTGANWEGMLAEIRKYGCSLMLATQTLERLDTPERKLKAGILGNVGCVMAYQMSHSDAVTIAAEMDAERVHDRFLVTLDPRHCYIKINSDRKSYPAFSMETLAPPDNTHPNDIGARLVLEESASYTVDWQESLLRRNKELKDRRDASGGKIGSDVGSGVAKAPAKESVGAGVSAGGGGESPPPARAFRGAGVGEKPVGASKPDGGDDSSPFQSNGSSSGVTADPLINPDVPMELIAEAMAGNGDSGGEMSIYDQIMAVQGEVKPVVASPPPAVAGGAGLGDEYNVVGGNIVGKGPLRGLRLGDVEASGFAPKVLELIIRHGHSDAQVAGLLDKRLRERFDRERVKLGGDVLAFLLEQGLELSKEETVDIQSGYFVGEPRLRPAPSADEGGFVFEDRILEALASQGETDPGVRAALDKRLGDEIGAQGRDMARRTMEFVQARGVEVDDMVRKRLVGRFYERKSGGGRKPRSG